MTFKILTTSQLLTKLLNIQNFSNIKIYSNFASIPVLSTKSPINPNPQATKKFSTKIKHNKTFQPKHRSQSLFKLLPFQIQLNPKKTFNKKPSFI